MVMEMPIMSSIYLAGAVAVLGLIAQKSPVNKRVPVGQPYDVVLTASADFPNPLQDVDLTGVLRGPNGQELVVPGFWDGGRTFRLRFTLTAPGTWSYTTVSSDAGLDAKSDFIQAAAAPAARAFTAVAPGTARRPFTACDPDCSALFNTGGLPDLTKMRALDTTLNDAQRDGVMVDVRLFVQDTGSSAMDPNDYGVVEYLVARYAAYSNVVWCAGSPASMAGAGSRAAVRGLVRTLDPYFSVGGWQRPMFASCGDSQFKGDRK
jgi:hypothetical protein